MQPVVVQQLAGNITGMLKASSGVIQQAVADTDYLQPEDVSATITVLTDVQWNVTKLQIKTRQIEITGGKITSVGDETDWTDVATV